MAAEVLPHETHEGYNAFTKAREILMEAAAGLLRQNLIRHTEAMAEKYPLQRTPKWYAARESTAENPGTIGGSQLAKLMGKPWAKYGGMKDVVESKLGVRQWSGNAAVRWGTFLEGAIELAVAVELGLPDGVIGPDVSVPAPAGSELEGLHANSPDGYGIVSFARDPETGEMILWDRRARAAGLPRVGVAAVLLEFKCPHRRVAPEPEVPIHYLPQLWSGIAVAEHVGVTGAIFVDACYRACELQYVSDWSRGYAFGYHRERAKPAWSKGPIGWGLSVVYVKLDLLAALTEKKKAAAVAGMSMSQKELLAALLYSNKPEITEPTNTEKVMDLLSDYTAVPYPLGAGRLEDIVDLAENGSFDKDKRSLLDDVIALVDSSPEPAEDAVLARHTSPVWRDHREICPLDLLEAMASGGSADSFPPDLHAPAPPPGYGAVAVLPWKLMQLGLVYEPPRENFLSEVAPAIHEAFRNIAEVRAVAGGSENKRKLAIAFNRWKAGRTKPVVVTQSDPDYDLVTALLAKKTAAAAASTTQSSPS